MKFFQFLVALSLVALVFAVGFASHGALGSWVVDLVQQDPVTQFYMVFRAVFTVLTALLAVLVNVGLFAGGLFFTVALIQEVHYQLFQRRIISLLIKQLTPPDSPRVREQTPRERAEYLERIRRQREYREAQKFRRRFHFGGRDDGNAKGRVDGADQAKSNGQAASPQTSSDANDPDKDVEDTGQE